MLQHKADTATSHTAGDAAAEGSCYYSSFYKLSCFFVGEVTDVGTGGNLLV